MTTLCDLLSRIQYLDDREAIRFYNGFRTWQVSHRRLYRRAAGFANYLKQEGFQRGDRILLWGENRIEWVVAFWGSVARGVQVVPVDAHSTEKLVSRIQQEVNARLLVHGETAAARNAGLKKLSFDEVERLPEAVRIEAEDIHPSDIVEIVYTSGTTGEPKGVVHRHKNICANLRPFGKEIERYRLLARPFQPIRILDMLPLSHMYGQSMGMFIPVLLGGAAVFMLEYNPGAIIEAIHREKVSVLVAVPRLLKNLQKELERRFDVSAGNPQWGGLPGAVERWWCYRQVHSALGWKFWSVAVGGAQLDSASEAFWSRLGVAVIQGYGLTETSPVVTVNHPFRARRGSIGKALPGQEVKIGPDGEILVRGESVVSEYLVRRSEIPVTENGWLHTGDLGAIDGEGHLYYKGRKKEVIVTSEGLNVYPEDVEAVLNGMQEIRESVVVGMRKNGDEIVHAALILRHPSTDVEDLIRQANRQLEPHQKIRSWSIWPEDDFPRTPSTMKVKRREVAQRLAAGWKGETPSQPPSLTQSVQGILAQMRHKAASEILDHWNLEEELGLSSLEKVDLLARLENALGLSLDEAQFARLQTVGELKGWIRQQRGEIEAPEAAARQELPVPEEDLVEDEPAERSWDLLPAPPRWTKWWPIRWLRRLCLRFAILPFFRHYIPLEVKGLENLCSLDRPVIFAANHASHLDTVAAFAALPPPWRWCLAPAMAQEFFRPYFHPQGYLLSERLRSAAQYLLACGFFNAYPLPQRMSGVRQALKYTGELMDQGYSPLVYPEGLRSPDGNLQPFKPGIGYMALRLRAPVVPLHLKGLYQVYSIHHDWPEPGAVRVSVGKSLYFRSDQTYEEVTRQVEEAIRNLRS